MDRTHSNCVRPPSSFSRFRHLNDKGIKFRLHRSADHWLIRQILRRFVPGAPFSNSGLDGVRNQSTDFFALERDELFISIVFVELRTEIHSVNSRIISFHNEEVLNAEQKIVSFDNLFFQRRSGDTKSFSRRSDNRARLQQDNPILTRGVNRMKRNQMTGTFLRKMRMVVPISPPPRAIVYLR